jgi:hypothetical protein
LAAEKSGEINKINGDYIDSDGIDGDDIDSIQQPMEYVLNAFQPVPNAFRLYGKMYDYRVLECRGEWG